MLPISRFRDAPNDADASNLLMRTYVLCRCCMKPLQKPCQKFTASSPPNDVFFSHRTLHAWARYFMCSIVPHSTDQVTTDRYRSAQYARPAMQYAQLSSGLSACPVYPHVYPRGKQPHVHRITLETPHTLVRISYPSFSKYNEKGI